ncbi:hypothetical protein GPJ56_008036 [Histomonas meleagridis]|uniref:uncharacterized protein n=1 Tax=Histomonas meleagridis TaxID=135588 RepID=UPI003559B5A0|nr:hypothetical protein GPJ56_008036 [Histomonas meleagridis]KAH0804908.1 hypothetical protein GO595_002301 [Histomonas meleagridis]
MSSFKSNDLKNLQKYSSDYVNAVRKNQSPPSLQGSFTDAREKASNLLLQSIKALDYTCHWTRLVKFQLQMINQSSQEFDFRWNLNVTMSVCKLFTTFAKICLYIHEIPNCQFLVNIFLSSNLNKSTKLLSRSEDFFFFINSCVDNPLHYIAQEVSKLKDKVSVLIYQILPFFSSLFAEWTIFNWPLLSIYEYAPEDTIGSSMPIDELIYLANISPLQEMMFFFLLSYPSLAEQNQQFAYLSNGIFSECSYVFLSRTFSLPTKHLLKLQKDSTFISSLLSTLDKSTSTKYKTAHLHRIKLLTTLAEDVENFSGIDPNQFLRCIHQIRAITAFSYYEIDQFFKSREQQNWDSNHIIGIAKLHRIIDKIGEFFVHEKDLIQRFFVYNLSTADSQYLQQLLQTFGQSGLGQSGTELLEGAKTIKQAIESLDLQEFDSGTRYDFLPLLITYGRLLYKYNQISTQQNLSFMNPLFEHLSTIRLHCEAAQDPIQFFLDSCSFHLFWIHSKQLMQFVSHQSFPLNCATAIFHIFSFFNYDSINILSHENELKSLKDIFTNLRGKFASLVRSFLSGSLSSNSRTIQFTITGEIGQTLPDEQQYATKLLDPKYCLNESEIIEPIILTNSFINDLPQMIEEVMPGFPSFYRSTSEFNSYSHYVLNEITSYTKSNYFFKEYLKDFKKMNNDINTYFIFLASLFGNPKWDNLEFYPNEDALSKNLHLMPYAFELMMDLTPSLFENVNETKVKDGINEFFMCLHDVVDKKTSTKYNSQTGNPYLILVDKFPQYVTAIEYGQMEKVFPYGLLSSSYPSTTITRKRTK